MHHKLETSRLPNYFTFTALVLCLSGLPLAITSTACYISRVEHLSKRLLRSTTILLSIEYCELPFGRLFKINDILRSLSCILQHVLLVKTLPVVYVLILYPPRFVMVININSIST